MEYTPVAVIVHLLKPRSSYPKIMSSSAGLGDNVLCKTTTTQNNNNDNIKQQLKLWHPGAKITGRRYVTGMLLEWC